MAARIIRALTLVWLREQSHERGTEFAVVDMPDPAATSPVQVDGATARIWVREKRAEDVRPAGKAGK